MAGPLYEVGDRVSVHPRQHYESSVRVRLLDEEGRERDAEVTIPTGTPCRVIGLSFVDGVLCATVETNLRQRFRAPADLFY